MGRNKKNLSKGEQKKKISEIIELGRKKKHLSLEEINDILPIDITDQSEIDNLFDELDHWDIDIDEKEPFTIEKEKIIDTEEAKNALRSYMKVAGSYSLLTHEKEVEIAKGIEEMKKKINQMKKRKKISQVQYMNCCQQLNELRGLLIKSNLRLVINIAKRYNNPKLSILDLIQEGNIGLMKAVEKFKYKTGFKFSTYATWWIRQAITRAIADHSSTIRIPVHMIEKINKLKKLEAKSNQGNNGELEDEEIAKKLKIPVGKIKNIRRSMRPDPISIDLPVGDEERATIGDFIEDNKSPNPLKRVKQSLLAEEIEKALKVLDEREEIIIRLRFGLDEKRYSRTLEEVGDYFNLTRERIRQIESKAIQKLKNSIHSKKLALFLEGSFETSIPTK